MGLELWSLNLSSLAATQLIFAGHERRLVVFIKVLRRFGLSGWTERAKLFSLKRFQLQDPILGPAALAL